MRNDNLSILNEDLKANEDLKEATTKIDWKRKLTSRKFWIAVCAFVSLVMIACGKTEAEAKQVAAIIMAGAVVIGYILGEGLADASNNNSIEYIIDDELAEE